MGINVFGHDDAVDVEFTGLDRLVTLKGRVRLPMGVIADARLARQDELRPTLGLRLGGTYLPGVLAAGRFSARDRDGAEQLWDVYRDPEVLVIETKLDHPVRVVLQHPDRERLAWLIAERIDR
jgi:hypothetical protein